MMKFNVLPILLVLSVVLISGCTQTQNNIKNVAVTTLPSPSLVIINDHDKTCYGSHKCIVGEVRNDGVSAHHGKPFLKITFRDCNGGVVGVQNNVVSCETLAVYETCAFDFTVDQHNENYCSYSINVR